MGGYFVGVVRAPLTAVIILSETTGTTSAILPLFVACLVGDWAGSLVCRERLYHALAREFMASPPPAEENRDT
jgi:H+/Cl- antiporter ClcA